MHGIKMSRTRTAKTRFKSVLAWLRHISALRESSDVGRQKISRKRRSCPDSHLVRLPGGRPRDGNVQRASLDRNKRRWAVRAVQLLPLVAQELVRLRVVAKSSLAAASDVRRALRFAHEMRSHSKDDVSLLIALFFERAWRDAALSRHFLRAWIQLRVAGMTPVTATWRAIIRTCALAPPDQPNHRFWSGPSAFSAAKGPWHWDHKVLEQVARAMVQHRGPIDAAEYVRRLSELPYVSDYFAYTFLRIAETLGLVRLRKADTVAASMSGTVAALTSIVPIQTWLKTLRSAEPLRGCDFGLGDASLVVCETSKALQCFGFSSPKNSQEDHAAFLEEVGSGCGSALIRLLQSCDPLAQTDIMAEHGVRSTEAALVDKHVPTTSAKFDRSPHVCKGSETLAPLLLRQLQRRGYLIASCDSDGSV